MPGHAGIKGNERADSLASKPTVAGDEAMRLTRIVNTFRDTGQAVCGDIFDWGSNITCHMLIDKLHSQLT